jgi:hypothetical protein
VSLVRSSIAPPRSYRPAHGRVHTLVIMTPAVARRDSAASSQTRSSEVVRVDVCSTSDIVPRQGTVSCTPPSTSRPVGTAAPLVVSSPTATETVGVDGDPWAAPGQGLWPPWCQRPTRWR